MSNLVRSAQKQIVTSKSVSGASGKALVVAGAGGLGIWFLAGLIPFISAPVLMVMMVVLGIFMWE